MSASTPEWTADDLGITAEEFIEALTIDIVEPGEHIILGRKKPDRVDATGNKVRTGFIASQFGRSDAKGKTHISIGLQREPAASDDDDAPVRGLARQTSRSENWTGGWALVLDDILEKVKTPPTLMPSAIVETSPGSQQWWYVLEETLRGNKGRYTIETLIHGVAKVGMSDPGMNNVVRWARLPGSQPAGKKFKARVVHWDPETRFDPEQLAEAFGINMALYDERMSSRPQNFEGGDEVEDVALQFMYDKGLIVAQSGAWHTLLCPRQDEHTNANDPADRGAGYAPRREHSRGTFYCHHSHDLDITDLADHLKRVHGAPDDVIKAMLAKPVAPAPVRDLGELASLLGGVEGDNVSLAVPDGIAAVYQDTLPDPVGVAKALESRASLEAKIAEIQQDTEEQYNSLTVFDWVYNRTTAEFINTKTGEEVGVRSFDLSYRTACVSEDGTKFHKPSEYFIENKGRQISATMYRPDKAERVFMEHGIYILNSFKPWLVPEAYEDADVTKLCRAHLQDIFPDDWQTIEQWMAYQIQNPGVKIVRALLLVGCQGDGKTTIATMMAQAMGRENTFLVDEKAMNDRFSSWQQGHQLVFFEELRMKTSHKDGLMEQLKQPISNDFVGGLQRYKGEFQTKNVTNYLAMTNHWNAIPLKKGDRRWEVYQTRFDPADRRADFAFPWYWNELPVALSEHPGAVRGWLLGVDTSTFNPRAYAPITQAQINMAEGGRHEASFQLADVILRSQPNAHPDVLTLRGLQTAMSADDGRKVSRQYLAALLAEEGWRHTKRTRLGDGDNKEVIYYRGDVLPRDASAAEAKEYLDARNSGSVNLPELAGKILAFKPA